MTKNNKMYYIARDMDKTLFLFDDLPWYEEESGEWQISLNQDDADVFDIDEKLFQDVLPGKCIKYLLQPLEILP